MKPVFCFIDDAKFELRNFADHAAWAFERADFIYANTFDEARHALKRKRPLAFLLDLYGNVGGQKVRLPDMEALARRCPGGLELKELYAGLAGDPSEAGNQFLRGLFSQAQGWQEAFQFAAESLGQSAQYGLNNLKQVRMHYPWAAALGYSRKAQYADAALLSRAGLEGFMQKPQGGDDEAIAMATRQAAPGLAAMVYMAVDRRLEARAGLLGLSLVQTQKTRPLALLLLQCLQGQAGPAELAALQAEAATLGNEACSLILALTDWLEAKPDGGS